MLPTLSSLKRLRSRSWGNIPPCEAPVESCRYLPTSPLLLAMPLGAVPDFELSIMRADSQALAASTTVLPRTSYSSMSSLFTYETPVASPFLSVNTSRTIALEINSRLPVFNAGMTRQDDAEKSAYALQLRLHCPQ